MLQPDFDINEEEADSEVSEGCDDVVQELYDKAVSKIEEELGVKVERPTRHNVVFRIEGVDAEIDLQYAHTGEERFRLTDREMTEAEVDVEEFREEVAEEHLQRLWHAIAIYKAIADVQMKTVSQEVIEARYL